MNALEHKILKAPPSVYYIPNFITADEEEYLIEHIQNAPIPKWTQLAHRRLQNWGGIPHKNGMIVEPIPLWLQKFMNTVNSLNMMDSNSPNHVLINEYLPGQGILAHLDGPLFYPTVTTITCGSHTILEFLDRDENETRMVGNLLLEPRSLLILQEDMYHRYLHQINEIQKDVITSSCLNLDRCGSSYSIGQELERGIRYSLTIRHVPKTSKLKLKLCR